MKFYIVHINCDCSSYSILRTRIRWKLGPRCGCGKQLGPMQYSILGFINAKDFHEARRLVNTKSYPIEI